MHASSTLRRFHVLDICQVARQWSASRQLPKLLEYKSFLTLLFNHAKPLLYALRHTRLFSIAKSPPPVAPSRAFLPQRSKPDAFAESAPQLFVDQPENVTSTGPPPLFFYKAWTKNRGRNRRMKRYGYLTTEPLEEFGAPHFILPGDEEKSPLQFLDMSIWHGDLYGESDEMCPKIDRFE